MFPRIVRQGKDADGRFSGLPDLTEERRPPDAAHPAGDRGGILHQDGAGLVRNRGEGDLPLHAGMNRANFPAVPQGTVRFTRQRQQAFFHDEHQLFEPRRRSPGNGDLLCAELSDHLLFPGVTNGQGKQEDQNDHRQRRQSDGKLDPVQPFSVPNVAGIHPSFPAAPIFISSKKSD